MWNIKGFATEQCLNFLKNKTVFDKNLFIVIVLVFSHPVITAISECGQSQTWRLVGEWGGKIIISVSSDFLTRKPLKLMDNEV